MTKRLLTLLLAMTWAATGFSQGGWTTVPYTSSFHTEENGTQVEERWNENNGIYQNFKYDFNWRLNPGFRWVRIPTIQKCAVFSACADNINIIAYALVQDTDVHDVWEMYENGDLQGYYDAIKESGFDNKSNFTKCFLLGQHALKLNSISKVKDNRAPFGEITIYTTGFSTCKNGYYYFFSITVTQDVKDFFEEENIDISKNFFDLLFKAE